MALPSAVRRNSAIRGAARALLAPEVSAGSCSSLAANVFSFSMIVIEVRPMRPMTSSVGGGEIDNLSSA